MQATNSGLHTGKPVLNFNNSNTMNFNDACRRHRDRHDRDWWQNHCHTIILIGGGFYAWDLGYWYPAYGYDSYNSNYTYDGPIYGYDGLSPDQIIGNVQYALQQLGYFAEAVDGVLGPITQQAIADYQLDNGLNVTGAIDRPTLAALGFVDYGWGRWIEQSLLDVKHGGEAAFVFGIARGAADPPAPHAQGHLRLIAGVELTG
jgi:hypothetical protein